MIEWRYTAPKGEGYDPLAEAERLLRGLPGVLGASVEISFNLDRKPKYTPEEFAAYCLGVKEIGKLLAIILGEGVGTAKPIIIRSSIRLE